MQDIKNSFTYAYSVGTYLDHFQVVGADADSTNYIDLDKAGLGLQNPSKPIFICARVGVVFETATNIEILLESDTEITFSTQTNLQRWEFLVTTMTAGALLINQALPVFVYERYLQCSFKTLIGSDGSTGSIAIWLSDAPEPAEAAVSQVVGRTA